MPSNKDQEQDHRIAGLRLQIEELAAKLQELSNRLAKLEKPPAAKKEQKK